MDPNSNKTREDYLRTEIDSFSSLHKRIVGQSQLRFECLRVAKFAPNETRKSVNDILSSGSKFIDYGALLRFLNRRDWNKPIEVKDYIDRV